MHWRAYARPFAKRRAHWRSLVRGSDDLLPTLPPDERLILIKVRNKAVRHFGEVTALWRDFIAHMRAGER